MTGVGVRDRAGCGQSVESGERSEEDADRFKPEVVSLREDRAKDCGMAHTRGGAPCKKQPWGPHSRKNRAAPVEAWSASINLPWRAPCKNTAQALIAESIPLRLQMLRAYRLGSTSWEHVTISTWMTLNQNPVGSYLHLIKRRMATDLSDRRNSMLATL